jgi:dihydroorotase
MPPGTRILSFLLFLATTAAAQPYNLLIRNGYCIDPGSHRRDTLDIAILDNRIVRIAKHIDPHLAKKQLDARGLIVCPGLIDIHTHVFFAPDSAANAPKGAPASSPDWAAANTSAAASTADDSDLEYAGGPEALHPDSFSFRSGVTTVVDAGSSGWRNFPTFKARVIDHSKTRVLAFLNIVGAGMRGNPYEQDTLDMNGPLTAAVARRYAKDIVGIKVAHYLGTSWHPVDAAVRAGKAANIPVMIDFGEHIPPMSIRQLFEKHLRPHDIFTHCFAQLEDREPIVDPATGQLKPFVRIAQLKGIVFDVGYGEISFALSQAIPAIKAGFLPNSISTDLHAGATHDMLDILSEFLAMGVDLPAVIVMASSNPAHEIGRPKLGRLREGAVADIAVLKIQQADFEATDHLGQTITGGQKLICIWTIKDGRLVYSRNRPRL